MVKMASMQPPPNQPWQFSLRALLTFTTALAICAGIAVNYPQIGFAIGFIVVVSAAIYTADRLAGARPTPAVRRAWRWALVTAWAVAGTVMAGLSLTTLWLYGNPGTHQMSAWIVTLFFASGAIYCAFRGAMSPR
jgi:hypothetical protein